VKILLDNCVDWRVKRLLVGHDVAHCRELQWETLTNGKLLIAAAKAGFAAMITVDKKMKFEQNLDQLPLPIVEIDLLDSRLEAIKNIATQLNQALTFVEKSRFISIGQDGRISLIDA
jgi:hypothetical protein